MPEDAATGTLVLKGALAEPEPVSYASEADFEATTAGNADIPEGDIVAALVKASRDVDAYLAHPAPEADTLRIDVATLTPYQAAALCRATCEQALFRLLRSENEMAQDVDGITAVAGISFASQPPPRVGPQALEALQDAGLYKRSGCAPAPEEVETP